MADKERLGIEIYLDDSGFTNGIKKAQQQTAGLTKTTTALVPAVKSTEVALTSATKSASDVTQGIKKADDALTKLKRTGQSVKVKLGIDDKATETVKKVKDNLNAFKGKVYTATVNVRQNLAGAASGAANKLSGAMFGATAQMAGMAGIGFGIFDAVKGYADFEEEMSAVKAISGATGAEFDMLKEKAIQMGADTKYSALESAQAFRYMGMAGWKAQEMTDGIAGIMNLAAASGEDLALTADIVTDSLTAFKMQAKESAMFSDVLAAAATNSNTSVALMGQTFKYAAPVAGALGFNVQDTALAIGLMANSGIKGSEAGTSLRSMMTRLVKPTKESGEAMEMLGLSILDSHGNMKPFRQLIGDIRQGMSRLTPDSQAAVAGMLAGQEGMSGLLALVNAAESDFDKLAKAIDNSNGAAEKMAKIRMDNLKGDLETLSGDWDSFTTKIMGGQIGGFREIVQGIDNWFVGFADNVEKNGLNVTSILDGITSAIKELVKQTAKMEGLPSILSAATLAVMGVGAFKFGKKVTGLFRGVKGGKGSPTGGLTDDMTINAMHVTLNAAQLMSGSGQYKGLPGQSPSRAPKGAPMDKGWRGRLGGLGRGIGRGAGSIGRGLMKLGGKAAIPVALAMGAYDISTADDKSRAGAGLAGSLTGGLAGAKLGAMGGAALGSIVPGVGTAIGAGLGGLLGGLGGAVLGEELGQEIYDGITSNLDGLTSWFSGKWSSIVETCAPAINTMAGLVGFAYDWIVEKFSPAAQWFDTTVWTPVKEFANSAIDGITSAFSDGWESVKGVWNGAVGWFSANVWEPLKAKASEALSGLSSGLSAVQQRGSQITGIPAHATGTNYFGGGWTQINERGGEIVDLPTGSRIYPAATTRKMIADQLSNGSSGGNTFSISGNTFVVREEADIDRIAHALFSLISDAEVNYGGV